MCHGTNWCMPSVQTSYTVKVNDLHIHYSYIQKKIDHAMPSLVAAYLTCVGGSKLISCIYIMHV